MRVILAKTAGFCFGVDRAVNMAYELANSDARAATLGQLIHNSLVTDDLAAKGVRIISSPAEAQRGETVIIRAHGVAAEVYEELNGTGAEICDATCPFVKKIHRIVAENSGEDTEVFIAGDPNHPEVIGIKGHCKGEVNIFNSEAELDEIIRNDGKNYDKRIIAISQTTFSQKVWKICKEKIKKYYTNAKIFDTICFATRERQDEAALISKQSDMMIIIGDRHSSNTAKLKAVCSENCDTYLVERAAELNTINFSHCATVGVTAGASTPSAIIKEVLFAMSEIVNETTNIQVEEVPSEVAAAEDMDFSAALEESLNNMSTDQRVKGVVMGITPTEIQVDIGRKHAGFVPMDEYSADPNADAAKELKVGDTLDLIIMKTNDAEGTVMLSKRRFDAQKAWTDIIAAEEDGRVLEGTVAEDRKSVV